MARPSQEKSLIEIGDFREELNLEPSEDLNLSPFRKLMLVSALKPEALIAAVTAYVRLILGREVVEENSVSLGFAFRDASPRTALIFILANDANADILQRFAQNLEFDTKLRTLSLGDAQSVAAEHLLKKGRALGLWIFLENSIWKRPGGDHRGQVRSQNHPDFRLFLSSQSSTTFPLNVLQNSVKVASELPRTARGSLAQSFADCSLRKSSSRCTSWGNAGGSWCSACVSSTA